MHILHINLAKGFRGGERQTALLIDGLATHYPLLQQSLIVRHDSPIPSILENIANINIFRIRRPYIKCIFNLNTNIDIVHAHEAKACHLAYLIFTVTKIPYVITKRIVKPPKSNWFTQKIYKNTSHVISLSTAINTVINDYNANVNTQVIPDISANLPTDDKRIATIRSRYPEKTLIGHVGALVIKDKGQQYIIEAARHLEATHPHLHFLLIGDGQDEALLKQKALGLTNIEFVGFKSNIGDYLSALDIFLFPSLQEGLGSTLLDAMEASLPIVASEVGGIPDIIKHEKNGLLIPPRDALAIANAILVLVKNAPFAKNLGEQGNIEVLNYSPAAISQRYMEVYKTICNNKP